MTRYNDFRPGDAVYDGSREKNSNGTILYTDHHEEIIVVEFYHEPFPVEYDFSVFEGKWTDKFGGTWFLAQLGDSV